MTNITAMFRTRHAAAVPLPMLLVAIAAGCSYMSDEETATDLLEISTSWPIIQDGLEADYRLFVLAWSEQVCRSCAETYLGYFNQYIATYVASQCDSGGKLTSKGFRDFFVETIGLTTESTAKIIDAPGLGTLKIGSAGDATILRRDEGKFIMTDSVGRSVTANEKLAHVRMIRSGRAYRPWK